MEGDIVENQLVIGVAEDDVVEMDVATHLIDLGRVRGIDDFWLGVEQIEYVIAPPPPTNPAPRG